MSVLHEYRTVLLLICSIAVGVLLLYVKALPKSTVYNLRGPSSPSWVLGNMEQYESSDVGSCDNAWAKQFGSTWRIDGGFSEAIIVSSDPKALHHVTSSYNFQRHETSRAMNELMFGKGILATVGEDHKRHRKVMLPSFAVGETRALNPIFQSKAAKMIQAWVELLKIEDEPSVSIDVQAWLARATLDTIGEAAFDYDFGALEEQDNPLTRNFSDLLISVMRVSLRRRIAMQNILQRLPFWVWRLSMQLPTRSNKRRTLNYNLNSQVAKELIDAKKCAVETENAQRDVMSILVRSNASENKGESLSEKEMIAQMNSIVFAGHETTGNLLAWTMFELAKNLDIQEKLRDEIRHWYRLARENGKDCINVSDYEKMEYTTAVIKESMRFHPVVPRVMRVATGEDVIPLQDSITGKDGQSMQSIHVKKGQSIMISVAHYNKRQELWGDDVECFRPERWLNTIEAKTKFGVYGNLATFGAGIHACIGWRFAVYEMQSFLIEMVNNFEFRGTEDTKLVRRMYALVMVPVLTGRDAKTCLPLEISSIE